MTNGMISISPSSTSLTYLVIFQLHLHIVYIYCSLFDIQELARHTISFFIQGSLLTVDVTGVSTVSFTGSFPQIVWCLQRSYYFLCATCCVICFIPIIKLFLTTDLDYGSYRLSNVEKELTVCVTVQQGVLTPPWHLIPSLIYSEARIRPLSDLYFL
jgi:hypothetical protein